MPLEEAYGWRSAECVMDVGGGRGALLPPRVEHSLIFFLILYHVFIIYFYQGSCSRAAWPRPGRAAGACSWTGPGSWTGTIFEILKS